MNYKIKCEVVSVKCSPTANVCEIVIRPDSNHCFEYAGKKYAMFADVSTKSARLVELDARLKVANFNVIHTALASILMAAKNAHTKIIITTFGFGPSLEVVDKSVPKDCLVLGADKSGKVKIRSFEF